MASINYAASSRMRSVSDFNRIYYRALLTRMSAITAEDVGQPRLRIHFVRHTYLNMARGLTVGAADAGRIRIIAGPPRTST